MADHDCAGASGSPLRTVALTPRRRTPPPLSVGSQLAFVAGFLVKRLEYTDEIRELVAGERLVMSTAEGPFPMQTTYTWADAGADATRMALRNRGQPTGFAKIGAPVMAAAMRRANAKDLRRLKEIREGVGAGCGGCPTSGGPLPSRWKFTVTTATR